jgi:hypothetical protein
LCTFKYGNTRKPQTHITTDDLHRDGCGGVNTINKAIDSHQTWRLVIAVIPTLMFSAATILVIMKYKYESKEHEESSENGLDQ